MKTLKHLRCVLVFMKDSLYLAQGDSMTPPAPGTSISTGGGAGEALRKAEELCPHEERSMPRPHTCLRARCQTPHLRTGPEVQQGLLPLAEDGYVGRTPKSFTWHLSGRASWIYLQFLCIVGLLLLSFATLTTHDTKQTFSYLGPNGLLAVSWDLLPDEGWFWEAPGGRGFFLVKH